MTGTEAHGRSNDDEKGYVPRWGDDESPNRDRAQLRLRPFRPVLVFDIDRLHQKVMAKRRRERTSRGGPACGAVEKRPDPGGLVRFLNRGGLEVVKLGKDELLQLRVAARCVNVERGPGFTQKYL